ncbi:hypothetical protein EB796_003134 [Bugula neritina]|uniref:Uncharacterized protein n=1 Tax=Bugula neritina TaxID=10212 RepID=A0A7J7KIM5_BUGNE|nr:hypothetical protein EB796_003134 [Bugula neritina]
MCQHSLLGELTEAPGSSTAAAAGYDAGSASAASPQHKSWQCTRQGISRHFSKWFCGTELVGQQVLPSIPNHTGMLHVEDIEN